MRDSEGGLSEICERVERLRVANDCGLLLMVTDVERAYENTIHDLLGDIGYLLFTIRSESKAAMTLELKLNETLKVKLNERDYEYFAEGFRVLARCARSLSDRLKERDDEEILVDFEDFSEAMRVATELKDIFITAAKSTKGEGEFPFVIDW